MKFADVNWTHVKIKKALGELFLEDIFRAIKDLIKGEQRGREFKSCSVGCKRYYSVLWVIKWKIKWTNGKLESIKWGGTPKMSLAEAVNRLERKRLQREQYTN